MDLEELNKAQIILLVLLVSFVTSIATGIVTVSLLAQAPPAVTQTVNRIVERTVETVVPSIANNTPAPTKETTVVVKEDDLITDSIAKSLQKTARVFAGTGTTSPVVALAAQIAPGVLVTDSSAVSKEHLVSFGDSSSLFTVSQTYPDIGIAFLTPKATTTSFSAPFHIGDVASTKLGQTIIAFVSITAERVSIGSVAARFALAPVTPKSGSPISVRAIDTNIDATLVPGAPLVNVFGDLVGISTGQAQLGGGKGTFVAASDIVALLISSAATSTPAH